MKKYISTILFLALTPFISFAAQLDGLQSLLATTLDIIKMLIPITYALAVLYFFWGMAQFVLRDAGNDKTREDGKKKMLWGIIALFVMVSITGIIAFIGDTLGVTNTSSSLTGTAGGDTAGNGDAGDCFDCGGGL